MTRYLRARVCTQGRTPVGDVLVEPDAGASFRHDRRERRLAHLERVAAQNIAVQFDQVEGVIGCDLSSAFLGRADEIFQ